MAALLLMLPRETCKVMKEYRSIWKIQSVSWETALLAALITVIWALAIERTQGAGQVLLWDTISPRSETRNVEDRTGWKPVPTDLLTLEADPPKASSDPGYYGREYSFRGDAVVENHNFTAVFWSAQGRVVLYSRNDATSAPGNARFGQKIAEIIPAQAKGQRSTIRRCEILRNAADEVALQVFFGIGSTEVSAAFVFDRTEILEIKPARNMKGISLLTTMEHAVVPSFIGDDLIFSPADYPSTRTLLIPAENILLGLLKGEKSELVMTWPQGDQQLTLQLSATQQGERLIERIDFHSDGQSFYLASLNAPGIWHRETLAPSYLEKDAAIKWRKPFPAKWKTQLSEAGVRTTFAFREARGQVWRGVPGSYQYPVWFDGDAAFYHLSKKVPPKGESLIYFLEGNGTPPSVPTPVDIMKATLGRQSCEPILDIAGRKLRTHHRSGGTGIGRACTCGYTEAIQTVFEKSEEVARKEYIKAALQDMTYFVQHHIERIDEYRQFAGDTIKFLQAQGNANPEIKSFVETLEQIVQQIPQEYSVQKDNMKSLDYAADLTRQTLALTNKKDPNNLKTYMELLKAWRAMGGAQDYVLAQCHTITRKLCQEAGYKCENQPGAIALAQELRARCRQALRNPDGYEIWADY
jgi:hypothetical protein